MTEKLWLAWVDPEAMLDFLRDRAHERKLRLFAVACCRRVWNALHGPGSRGAVEVAERYADGTADDVELLVARTAAEREINPEAFDRENPAYWVAHSPMTVQVCLYSAGWADSLAPDAPWLADSSEHESARAVERASQAEILREVFGNPFRPVSLDPRWRSETVVALAAGIYAERAFDRMPILADALEDAGCDHADILAHCRGDEPHVRGCWLVDLLLGKS